MKDSTKKYYEEKAGKITQIYAQKISDNYEDYEGFINIPFAKSMIRLKFDVDLGDNTKSMSEEDVFNMVVDESLNSLIYSGVEKQIPNKENYIYLSNQMPVSSARCIMEFLDSALKIEQENKIQQEVDKIRYMYIGEKHLQFIPYMIKKEMFGEYMIKKEMFGGYVGEYKGIKIFYIDKIENIYITSAPFIDLTTIDVRYNEYIKKQYDKLYNSNSKYEEIENKQKNAVVTLNCNLGDVKIYKLNTIYGGKAYMRKLKLQKILKNEIDI